MSRLAGELERLELPNTSDRLERAGAPVLALPGWREAGLVNEHWNTTERGVRVARCLHDLRACLTPGQRHAGPLLQALTHASVLLAARLTDDDLDVSGWSDAARAEAAVLVRCGLLRDAGADRVRLTLAGAAFLERARDLAREIGAPL